MGKQLIVERAEIEGRPVPLLELATKAEDLALAEHVGQRLSRPGDVPVRLDASVGIRQQRADATQGLRGKTKARWDADARM